MKADRSDKYYLEKILKHCGKIDELTKRFNGSLEVLETDFAYEQSVVLSIIQIGEAAKRLSVDLVEKYNAMDWKEICRFRDKVTHHYDEIEEDIVWDTITDDIPKLKNYCEQILKKI